MRWTTGRPTHQRHDSVGSVSSDASVAATPLPRAQLTVLCLMRLAEPLSFFVVFPFLPSLIRELGVTDSDEKVGHYAGLVESLFAATQFATILQYGRLSDRIGRKPVLMIGLLGSSLSILSFGFAKTFAGIILARCLNGALNGNVAIIKSVVGELSDDSNQARAFSFLPLMAGLGSSIGPLLGGYLAHPVEQYPSVFGGWTIFERYPYLLPCLCAAIFTLSAALLGLCCLKETLVRTPSTKEAIDIGDESTEPLLEDENETTPAMAHSEEALFPVASQPLPLRRLLTSQVCFNIAAYMLLVLASNAYLSLVPLFCFTPIAAGGVGFSQHQIGLAMGVRGLSAVFLQIFLFPPVCNRLGPARTFKTMIVFYPLLFWLFPLMNLIARGNHVVGVWALLILTIIGWSLSNIAFAANMILVTSMAPSRADLGTLHGLTQSSVSFTRIFAPSMASSFFALSVDNRWLNGYFVYTFFSATSILLIVTSMKLKDHTPTWRQESPKKRRRRGTL